MLKPQSNFSRTTLLPVGLVHLLIKKPVAQEAHIKSSGVLNDVNTKVDASNFVESLDIGAFQAFLVIDWEPTPPT